MSMFFSKLSLEMKYRPAIAPGGEERSLAGGAERVVIAPHFASAIDPILFAAFCPGPTPFVAVPPAAARDPGFGPRAELFRHEVIDLNDPFSLKKLCSIIEEEPRVVIFPEPEPTTNGLLMKLSDVAAEAFARTGATVVPARAKNTQFTRFSRLGARLAPPRPPRPELFFGRAVKFSHDDSSPSLTLDRAMRDMMAESMFDHKPLFDTMLEMREIWGEEHIVAIEPTGARLSWDDMITRTVMMAGIISGLSEPGESIGIMLPNSSMTLASIIGAQRAGRVPAMLNYSMGARALIACVSAARVRTALTSSRFVEEGKLSPLIDAISAAGVRFVYVEDEIGALSPAQKLKAAANARFASPSSAPAQAAEETAVILFTSGSEGTPKAVALSHENIQANTAQIRSTLDFFQTDVMMALMPMFHSFGLSTGVFMPLSAGMATAYYPTPLHFKKIPQYCYSAGGTILLGTNTFLAGYAKSADRFDFREIRYVVAGGDKLKESTAALWIEKFGITPIEGYGVTEMSPVISVNRYGHNMRGSVGQPLPLIECRLAPVEGVEGAGRLIVRGPNVMRGLIAPDGSITPPAGGEHDTGDIVSIDADGYITIEGRAKRFAKIGGEMISLAHVEEAAAEFWPDDALAIVAVEDTAKGETLVMLTERKNASRDDLRAGLLERGIPEIAVPRKIIELEALPRIGVGKVDYTAAAQLAAGNI